MNQKQDTIVTVELEESLLAELEQIAEAEGMSRDELIRKMVKGALPKRKA